ncbi:MAG: hypothetical protein O2816_16765 [Planctomycetota bacterium]|nr:hypothetical protein [Planctomycetota bacterium]
MLPAPALRPIAARAARAPCVLPECLAGQIARIQPVASVSPYGTVEVPVDSTAIPTTPAHDIQPGETWNFQLRDRDLNPGSTSNPTNGVSITFP